MLYGDIDIQPFKRERELCICIHRSIKQSFICVQKLLYKKKNPVLLIPDKISIEEELINIINVSVKHDKPKFENYVYRECSNGVNRFFTNIENINKCLHYILDEDDDDDDDDDDALISDSINFYNHFTTSNVLYDIVNSNSPLNEEEYDHEDDINFKIIL